MRVLMFGWEFPPHLSGGLGTACEGLVQALTHDKVDILYVTPYDISYPQESESLVNTNSIEDVNSGIIPRAKGPQEQTGELKKLRVQSSLNPYNRFYESTEQNQGLAQWNYMPKPQHSQVLIPQDEDDQTNSENTKALILDEVYRFRDKANQFVKRYCFDIIHAHDWMTFEAAVQVKESTGKPLIVHIHSTEYDRWGKKGNPIIHDMERKGMNTANLVIAVSERTKNTIIKHYKIDPNKIYVVHNGVHPLPGELIKNHALGGKKFVTFLGRVTHQKGPGYFVDAAYQVHQKFPDIHFILAGAGDMLPAMMEKVAALRMSSNFHFTGFLSQEQVESIWSITSVYVMTSISEPFGITPLEAMRAGVPVIISKQSGAAEILDQAIKVDFWNTTEIADAICDLLSRKNYTKAKSRKELKNFSWAAASKKIIKAYETLTH